MPWVVDDAGLLFEPGSVTEPAERVVQILQDDNLRQALVDRGLERVQAFSLERYEVALAEIVDKAMTYTLPRATTAAATDGSDEAPPPLSDARPRDDGILVLLADEIEARSDVALREYTVRSGIPLVGPLVAWVRRNLTSHLREPYLNPRIDRQVSLNRQIAEWLKRAATTSSARSRRQDELETRVQALEAQVEALTRESADEDCREEQSL
jgi:hypothetical protein